MIGLLKSANIRLGVNQPTSGRDILQAQETSNIEGGLDARSGVGDVCKQNFKQQQIALDCYEDAGSILGRKKCSKEACSSTPTNKFCDLAGAKPRKRQRIVSDTSCNHRFEPWRGHLNEHRNQSSMSPCDKLISSREIPQASHQCPIGTPTRHSSKKHKDSFCDKAFYKACYTCSHCSKENSVIVETHICPVKIQKSTSASSESGALKTQCIRRNVASTVCSAFDKISNWDSYGNINFNVKEEQIGLKEEKTSERQKGVLMDSEKDLDNHSFHNQNSNYSHVSRLRSNNLATLKVFASDENKRRSNLVGKQLSMSPSEKLDCRTFTPRQYFDINSEQLQVDERKLFVSEESGKKNNEKTGIQRENFVKELKSIFSRLPLVKEERLKEEGVYEMILMAKAYCEKFEFEAKEYQDRESNLLDDWKSARLFDRVSPAVEQRNKDVVSNEYERNVTSFRSIDHSPNSRLTVKPASAIGANDMPFVDHEESAVESDGVIESNRKSVQSSQSCKNKFKNILTPKELTTAANEETFRNDRTAECSGIALNSNFNVCKNQNKIAGLRKKSRLAKESSTHNVYSTCSKCDNNASMALETVFSTSNDSSSADQTKTTGASIKKRSISMDKTLLTQGISVMEKGSYSEGCRFNDQSGEEKEHGKIENSATTEVPSQGEIVIADALLNLTTSQPTYTDISSTLLSKQHEIAAFSLVEAKRFYSDLLLSFVKESQSYLGNFYKKTINNFKICKEKELTKRTEIILKEKRKEMNLKLECEMALTMQYFRQELWIRIQKCVCGKVGQYSCCSRCNLVFYCSKMCQVVDYMDHRLICVENSQDLDVK